MTPGCNQTRATMEGGEGSHQCVIPAPLLVNTLTHCLHRGTLAKKLTSLALVVCYHFEL